MSSSVSIIIATYNDADNLAVTLASVHQQDGIGAPDVEVIISDGASTDGTPAVVEKFADVITFFDSRPDSGVYDAMNIGAERASMTWLHFLNAGDTFRDASSLTTWRSALDASQREQDWVVAGALNLRSHSAPAVPIPNVPHSWWLHAIGIQPHCHQATWFRRSLFEAVGGYTLRRGMAADYDLILQFGMIGRPLEIPVPIINYVGGGMSERGRSQIPGLLHAARVERLNLGVHAAAIDLAISKCVGWLNIIRRLIGSTRLHLSAINGRRRRSTNQTVAPAVRGR